MKYENSRAPDVTLTKEIIATSAFTVSMVGSILGVVTVFIS
jgi:hypothetical protein